MKIYKNKKIAGRMVDDEFYLLNPETRELLILNETGTIIWQSIEKNISKEEIVEIIFDNYDSTREKIEDDLKMFLEKLQKFGMIRIE